MLLEVLKKMEFSLLQEFNASLSDEEKEIVKQLQQQTPLLNSSESERRRVNLMVLSWIEGYRAGKKAAK